MELLWLGKPPNAGHGGHANTSPKTAEEESSAKKIVMLQMRYLGLVKKSRIQNLSGVNNFFGRGGTY